MDSLTLEQILADPRMKSFLRNVQDDDLRQEARIVIWKHLPEIRHDQNPVSYLIQRAKWRISSIRDQGKSWTGENRTIRKHGGVKEHPVDDIQDWSVWQYDEPAFESPDYTYLYEAMRYLTESQLQKVLKKFWADEDINLTSWWGDPKRGAKAKLKTALIGEL